MRTEGVKVAVRTEGVKVEACEFLQACNYWLVRTN